MSITKQDCVNILRQSGVSELDARQTVESMIEQKASLAAAGKLERGAADLVGAVRGVADEARIHNALQRRNTAITIMRRMELDGYAQSVKDAGFTFLDAMESTLVGSSKRLPGARASVDARRASIEAEWSGQFQNEVAAIGEKFGLSEKQMFALMAQDEKFQLDFASERMQPGSSGDPKAQALAELYGRLSEAQRTRLNSNGANIGRLEGRLPQSHDPVKLQEKGGKEAWMRFTEERLDAERSFPGKTREEVSDILGSVYDTIVTGKDLKIGDETPAFPAPRNIASSLGRHRVLHFKDAQAALEYTGRYGRGNLFDSVFGEMQANARKAALMEVLGPNPEAMIRTLLNAEAENLRAQVKAGTLDASAAEKQIKALNNAFAPGIMSTGQIARWMAVLTGETQMASSVGLAKAGGIARSIQHLAKLGFAALSTVADGFTKAGAMRVDGFSFLERTFAPFADYFKSYKGDKRALARELGMLTTDINGSLVHRFDQAEAVPGRMSSAVNLFFKWTGMLWATEQQKAGFAMRLSNFLGRERGRAWGEMNPDLRAMLEYHGFDEARWDIFRKHMVEGRAGDRYLNPARRAI